MFNGRIAPAGALLALILTTTVTPASAQQLGWVRTLEASGGGVRCLGKCWTDRRASRWRCTTISAEFFPRTCAIYCGESRMHPSRVYGCVSQVYPP